MADTLSDRLRGMADHIDAVGKAWDQQYAIGFGADEKQCAIDLREAAAELDRREARLTALEQALRELSERHSWVPEGGPCICKPHLNARELLAALKG